MSPSVFFFFLFSLTPRHVVVAKRHTDAVFADVGVADIQLCYSHDFLLPHPYYIVDNSNDVRLSVYLSYLICKRRLPYYQWIGYYVQRWLFRGRQLRDVRRCCGYDHIDSTIYGGADDSDVRGTYNLLIYRCCRIDCRNHNYVCNHRADDDDHQHSVECIK